MKKNILTTVAAVLTLTMFAGCGMITKTEEGKKKEKEVLSERLVAKGKGIEITAGEVEERFKRAFDSYIAQGGKIDEKRIMEQKAQFIDSAIDEKIVKMKIDELKIPQESSNISFNYEKIKNMNSQTYGSREGFEKALQASGMTYEEYDTMVKSKLREQELYETLTKDITVTDEEVKAEYEKNKETVFKKRPGATIYHIFFGTPEDPEAETKAKEAKAKLDAGADFGEIAKEYGKDGTAPKGGLLGDYEYDTKELGADFMEFVKPLKEGEISQPVKTSFGWHIIKVTGVRNADSYTPFEEVSEDLKNQLLMTKKNTFLQDSLTKWKEEMKISKYPENLLPVEVPESAKIKTTPKNTTPTFENNTSNTSNTSNSSNTSNASNTSNTSKAN